MSEKIFGEHEKIWIGQEILRLPEINSTNTYLKEAALDGAPEGTVVIAEHQTAGRGRLSRSFQSPKGKGLYCSVLLQPEVSPERLPLLTPLAGIAVCCAIERICGMRPGIKWPNDVLLHRKKLAGILTELVVTDEERFCVVLGIGINVSHTLEDFSPDVAAMATSLSLCFGKEFSKEALIDELLKELNLVYAAFLRNDLQPYLDIYCQDCVTLGKKVQLVLPSGERETAEAVNIDEEFGLLVRTEDGDIKTVREGEVSVRGLYGYLE